MSQSHWWVGEDVIVRGGREGCEDGVTRENTTHIDLIDLEGKKARSTNSKSRICENAKTSSRTQVQGTAKIWSPGHFKNSRGEICNSVTYIPSSRNRLARSCSPHSTSTRTCPYTRHIISTHLSTALRHDPDEAEGNTSGVIIKVW